MRWGEKRPGNGVRERKRRGTVGGCRATVSVVEGDVGKWCLSACLCASWVTVYNLWGSRQAQQVTSLPPYNPSFPNLVFLCVYLPPLALICCQTSLISRTTTKSAPHLVHNVLFFHIWKKQMILLIVFLWRDTKPAFIVRIWWSNILDLQLRFLTGCFLLRELVCCLFMPLSYLHELYLHEALHPPGNSKLGRVMSMAVFFWVICFHIICSDWIKIKIIAVR